MCYMATVGGIVASGDGVEYEIPLLILLQLYEDATDQPSRLLSSACSCGYVSIGPSSSLGTCLLGAAAAHGY